MIDCVPQGPVDELTLVGPPVMGLLVFLIHVTCSATIEVTSEQNSCSASAWSAMTFIAHERKCLEHFRLVRVADVPSFRTRYPSWKRNGVQGSVL